MIISIDVMKKLLIILICLLFPINVFASNFEIKSKSAIVVNRETDEILYEKEKDLKLPIASLTKIMTVMISLENINSLSDTVVVNSNDISNLLGYQVIGLTNGIEVSYKDLIYSTLLYSAADSAKVLSNNVFNKYDDFINKMNELANMIGMENTNFSNPIGFDKDNYSSSYDLYKLLEYALDNETFYDIFTTKNYKMEGLDKSINNNLNSMIDSNNLKRNNISFDGFKGGYTKTSGLSLGAITKIDDNELIIVTIGAMGEIDSKKNIIDALNILSNIKDNYSNRVILANDKLVDNIIYKDGEKEISYEIRSPKTLNYYMNNSLDLNYLKIFYEGTTIINEDVKEGDKLGKVSVYYEDKLLDSVDIKFNKKYLVKDSKNYKNILIFVCICLLGLIVFRKKK